MQLEILNPSDRLIRINIPEGTKIVIVEGFDTVGKTTLMDKLVERSQLISKVDQKRGLGTGASHPEVNLWKPNYSNMKKSFLPYSGRYILNLALLDIIEQSVFQIPDREILLVDRGLLSALVYSELKDQDNRDYVLNDEFLSYVKRMYSSDLIYHLYVQPQSKETHHEIYHNSKQDLSRENEEYDMLDDFDAYYKEYQLADKLFRKYLSDLCEGRYSIIDPENYQVVN